MSLRLLGRETTGRELTVSDVILLSSVMVDEPELEERISGRRLCH